MELTHISMITRLSTYIHTFTRHHKMKLKKNVFARAKSYSSLPPPPETGSLPLIRSQICVCVSLCHGTVFVFVCLIRLSYLRFVQTAERLQ